MPQSKGNFIFYLKYFKDPSSKFIKHSVAQLLWGTDNQNIRFTMRNEIQEAHEIFSATLMDSTGIKLPRKILFYTPLGKRLFT